MKHSKLKKALSITLAVLLLCCGAVGIYASDYYKMSETALFAMESTDTITVTNEQGLAVFSPKNPQVGLIFYPGGKVEYTAYAPLMQMLAENGVLCTIPHMPFCSNWDGDAMYCFDITDKGMVFRSKDSAPLYAHASVFDSNPNAQTEVPDGAIYTP